MKIIILALAYLIVSVVPSYSAGQAVIGSEVATSKPAIYNLTLTAANTEYTQVITNIHTLKFQCRTSDVVRYAYVADKVAGSTAPYMTLKANQVFSQYNVSVSSMTLYFASGDAGVVMEITKW